MPGMRTAIVIPSLGAPSLPRCLAAVAGQRAQPDRVVVVLSGPEDTRGPSPPGVEVIAADRRLGFAAAANRGIRSAIDAVDGIAVLNDDAEPGPDWLGGLAAALAGRPDAASVQGTVTDPSGTVVDGRGIALDRFGLPIQVDRGQPASDEGRDCEERVGISATAGLYRCVALQDCALGHRRYFDEGFGSFHEDVDLALRLGRHGWSALWAPHVPCRHLGSATARRLRWRHPWWVLANRWRAIAGNLTPVALAAALPRLLRGEIRAVRSLARVNRRAWAVAWVVAASLPLVLAAAQLRPSSGPRLRALPGACR
jgi:GT2 family glycosyltransferase